MFGQSNYQFLLITISSQTFVPWSTLVAVLILLHICGIFCVLCDSNMAVRSPNFILVLSSASNDMAVSFFFHMSKMYIWNQLVHCNTWTFSASCGTANSFDLYICTIMLYCLCFHKLTTYWVCGQDIFYFNRFNGSYIATQKTPTRISYVGTSLALIQMISEMQYGLHESFDHAYMSNFCGSMFDRFEYLPSIGASGDILQYCI